MVRLTEVFCQAQTGSIITNAHHINQGQYPKLEPIFSTPQSDCLWFRVREPSHGVEAIRTLVSDLSPSLGFNPSADVQVLCPLTRGEAGTRNLNSVLQQLINSPSKAKAEIVKGEMTLRVGEHVIPKKNDYDREVFNGNLGFITDVDLEDQEVTVKFEQRLVTYDYTDLDEIVLAWSITVHKSQSSEYLVVILPVFMQSHMMLTQNLQKIDSCQAVSYFA